MINLRTFSAVVLAAGISVLIISCAPEACFEETTSFLKASFYSNSTRNQLAPDSLTVIGLGQTAKIYNKAEKVQPALLPLNPSAGSCTFLIRINNVTDTIEFVYLSYPHLISKECGYTFFHTLNSHAFTQNSIDTVLIMNRNITTANNENIRLFY